MIALLLSVLVWCGALTVVHLVNAGVNIELRDELTRQNKRLRELEESRHTDITAGY